MKVRDSRVSCAYVLDGRHGHPQTVEAVVELPLVAQAVALHGVLRDAHTATRPDQVVVGTTASYIFELKNIFPEAKECNPTLLNAFVC